MMQRIKFFLLILTIALIGGVNRVNAQSIVVEEETPPPEQSLAGYDGGFFVRSPDGNFKLTINGRVQPQFIYTKQKVGPVGSTQGKTLDTFFVRRGRFAFTAELFQKLEMVVFADHHSRSGRPLTPFIWLTYHIYPAFNLTAGMVGLPMDRAGEGASGWMQMVEGPLTAAQEDGVKDLTISRQSFGLPFDLGLRAEGDIGKFFYAVGLGNGSGAWSGLNPNDAFSVGMRVAYNILGSVPYKDYVLGGDEEHQLAVGFGTGFEDENATETVAGTAVNRDWRWTLSGDVAWRWQGWSVTGEYYYRMEDIEGVARAPEDMNGDGKLRDSGYYMQLGYFIIPKKLQLVALASQIFREGPDNNANEFGAGVNWYLYNNNVKLQFDYTNVLDYDDIFGTTNNTQHRFRTMLTAQF